MISLKRAYVLRHLYRRLIFIRTPFCQSAHLNHFQISCFGVMIRLDEMRGICLKLVLFFSTTKSQLCTEFSGKISSRIDKPWKSQASNNITASQNGLIENWMCVRVVRSLSFSVCKRRAQQVGVAA